MVDLLIFYWWCMLNFSWWCKYFNLISLFLFYYNYFIDRDNEVYIKGYIILKFIKVFNDIGILINIVLEYDKIFSVLMGWVYFDDW